MSRRYALSRGLLGKATGAPRLRYSGASGSYLWVYRVVSIKAIPLKKSEPALEAAGIVFDRRGMGLTYYGVVSIKASIALRDAAG